ncbi:putative chitin synthesis regulation, Congo red resistance, RCR protein [Septoria linicola]|nr:putative chitin synthesis regulation, Congo red resistance, RCR protein [Septoria linicola]
MASVMMNLAKRQTNNNNNNTDNDTNNDGCYNTIYGVRCYDSAWDSWVRWLVLALIIIAAFLLFFSFSCISARRRRKLGHSPYRGTGWALGRTPPGHAPAQYTGQQQPYYQNAQPYYNNSNNPPPAYTPPPNNGYYGNQNHNGPYGNDVELQQPQSTYSGYRGQEAGVYEPPKGPPPVVR